ncbi:flagellar biosynthetic protein FliR [Bacillus sp. CGMCC 1.16607]|uniref:flagellar biosynthetic protein FliR n=1 Tax=Bacillus sp. CGMCC 1.16607 TaxID=3351842 RepID=UPI00363FE15C
MLDFIPNFPGFLLVFVRVTSFFLMMPLFSYRTIPTTHKVGFGFFLSLIIYFTLDVPVFEIDVAYFFIIMKEAIVGISIGFVAYMMLSAIQVAGGLIDFQMGFAIANVIDPQTGAQSPLMGQYFYTIALLLMLTINGHHLIIDGIYHSFQFISLEQAWIPLGDSNLVEYILQAFSQMFMLAFQMALPVVGCLFLTDVALGIMARTVPQLNIFVVGVPVKIAVGLVVIFILMSVMTTAMSHMVEIMLYTMRNLMDLLGGK